MMSFTRAVGIGVFCGCVTAAQAGTVDGVVSVNGEPAAYAIVSLERADARPPAAPAPRVVMDQRNLAFVPSVLPVARGTIVEFTNSDDVQHNVFSPSAAAGKFNLGTHGPGAARTVTLDKPGEVLVLCNIHMEMEARILVLDTPFFSTANREGHYRIADVPVGSYAAKVWREHWLPVAQTVEVPAAGDVSVNITAGQ
jgi:plastocyanin